MNNCHEYLIQHSLKSGGTKDHFRQVKVPGTTSYWKASVHMTHVKRGFIPCPYDTNHVFKRGFIPCPYDTCF